MRRLIGIMAERGVSGVSLAKSLSISTNTFYKKLNGQSTFNTDQIKVICKVLHITDKVQKSEIFLD